VTKTATMKPRKLVAKVDVPAEYNWLPKGRVQYLQEEGFLTPYRLTPKRGARVFFDLLSRPGTRLTERLRYLLDTQTSGDLGLTGPTLGCGEGAVLLGAVVVDGVDPDNLALGRDLDRAGHDGHIDDLTSPAAPDPIASPGEGDRSALVHPAGDAQARSGWPRASRARSTLGRRSLVGPATLGVGGDEDAGVEDLDETRAHDDLDGLPGEGRPHPIAKASEGDRATLVDPAVHTGWPFTQRNLFDDLWRLEIGRTLGRGQGESFDRRAIAE
jgi:hypothetical protein